MNEINQFIDKIILSNSPSNEYFETPILKFIKVDEFVKTVSNLSKPEKKLLGWSIERRYRFPDLNSKLKEEIPCIKDVYDSLSKESEALKGKVSYVIIESILSESLKKIIETLGG